MKLFDNKKAYLLLTLLFIGMFLLYYNSSESSKVIKFGSSLPLSSITKELGISVKDGANVYFQYANDQKLLGEYSIEFLCYDDQYEPELTGDNLEKLLNIDKVFALFGFVGTPTIKSILPKIDDGEIPFIAPFSGAAFLRREARKNIINYRASYQEEVAAILHFLINIKKLTKFSIFYQSDDYGNEGYIATIKVLKKQNLELVSEGTYKRNTVSIRQALTSVGGAKPEAILLVGSYKPVAHFIKKYRELEGENTLFCNLSFVNADALVSELDFKTKNIIFSQTVPYYNNRSIPVVVEYQNLMQQYAPDVKLGFVSLEAFITAKVSVHALANMSDKHNRKQFVKNLQQIQRGVLDKIPLKYENRQLSKNVYLFEYKEHKFQSINWHSFE